MKRVMVDITYSDYARLINMASQSGISVPVLCRELIELAVCERMRIGKTDKANDKILCGISS
jgi:hypothetical protein